MDNKELETSAQSMVTATTTEKKVWDFKVISSFVLALVSIGYGFYKIFAYSNTDLGDKVNAYVGGDAYNYIINSNLGIAYFVLALIFVMLGCTILICNQLSLKNNRE